MNKKVICSTLLFIMIFSLLTTLSCAASTIYVYVTKSGSKYHLYSCHYLSNSCYQRTLSQAINSGYSPCSVCNPPVLSASSSNVETIINNNSNDSMYDRIIANANTSTKTSNNKQTTQEHYSSLDFLLDLLFLTATYMLFPIILKYRKIELDNSDIVVIILLNAILQFSIIKYIGTNREIDNILFPILYSILNYCMLHWNKTSTT